MQYSVLMIEVEKLECSHNRPQTEKDFKVYCCARCRSEKSPHVLHWHFLVQHFLSVNQTIWRHFGFITKAGQRHYKFSTPTHQPSEPPRHPNNQTSYIRFSCHVQVKPCLTCVSNTFMSVYECWNLMLFLCCNSTACLSVLKVVFHCPRDNSAAD